MRFSPAAARLVVVMAVLPLPATAGPSRLLDAVKTGDKAAAHRLVLEGDDVNATQADGATALHWASHSDDQDTAELLIGAGAKVNAANDLGITPLWIASANGSAAMIARLLNAGADPNIVPPTGVTPLMRAARTGSTAGVMSLLAHHADANAQEIAGGQTALMWAITERHPDVVRALIDRGADVHRRSRVWRQRVLTCCERYLGDSEGIAEMDGGGFTPLLFAARNGDLESAKAIVAGNGGVDDTAADGSSALAVAILSGHSPLAVYLLDEGADPDANAAGYTALHAAILRGDLDVVTALLRHGANPNAPLVKGTPTRRNEKTYAPDWALDRAWIGGTPFWLAARFADLEIMRVLAANGADTKTPASDRTTPLLAAAQADNVPSRRGATSAQRERRAVDALQLVLALGAGINETTDRGDTALHIAATKRLNTVVEFLAHHGAALDARNSRGLTPLAIATMEPEAPKGIAVIYNQPVNDGTTAELLRKLGATQ
jgi:uncharacterized protein